MYSPGLFIAAGVLSILSAVNLPILAWQSSREEKDPTSVDELDYVIPFLFMLGFSVSSIVVLITGAFSRLIGI